MSDSKVTSGAISNTTVRFLIRTPCRSPVRISIPNKNLGSVGSCSPRMTNFPSTVEVPTVNLKNELPFASIRPPPTPLKRQLTFDLSIFILFVILSWCGSSRGGLKIENGAPLSMNTFSSSPSMFILIMGHLKESNFLSLPVFVSIITVFLEFNDGSNARITTSLSLATFFRAFVSPLRLRRRRSSGQWSDEPKP